MTGFETKIRNIAAQYVGDLQRRLRGMPLQQLLGAVDRIDRAFAGAIGRVAPTLGAPAKASKTTAKRVVPKKRAPAKKPEAAAAHKPNPIRRIQGLYAGFLKNFSGRERAEIKALAKKSGQATALAEMKKRLAKTN
ncbi:MAG: hypothetical protein QME96_05410 [Myxococcota bacterium]|nr:hypothetical protein [Myxococcota bacterium]